MFVHCQGTPGPYVHDQRTVSMHEFTNTCSTCAFAKNDWLHEGSWRCWSSFRVTRSLVREGWTQEEFQSGFLKVFQTLTGALIEQQEDQHHVGFITSTVALCLQAQESKGDIVELL